MLNSSVRGPFRPPYLVRVLLCLEHLQTRAHITQLCMTVQGRIIWHRLLTERLNSDVLAVGPTISCEGSPNRLNMYEVRQNPHVQSYVLAVNRVRLVCTGRCCSSPLKRR